MDGITLTYFKLVDTSCNLVDTCLLSYQDEQFTYLQRISLFQNFLSYKLR